MNETRTSAIVAGSAVVAGSLWAPWYSLDISAAARSSIGAQASQLPGVIGEFARQALTYLPAHIQATGWQAFDKADVVLFACAIVAVMATLIDRMDVVAIAGVAAAGTVVLEMIDQPGPNAIVSVKWGAWLALAGALAIVGASRMRSERAAETASPVPDWTARTSVPPPSGSDPAESFAPF